MENNKKKQNKFNFIEIRTIHSNMRIIKFPSKVSFATKFEPYRLVSQMIL